MATVLHRLGRWCANHPWRVILAWAVLLGLTLTGMLTLSKPLSNDISIPGSRFEEVMVTLKSEIPEAAGITGTVVFVSDTPFTDEQQRDISAAIDEWEEIDGLVAVNPFETQAQIDGRDEQLADARAQLEAGRAELEAGEAELAAGRAELEAGQQQLEGAIALGLVSPEEAAAAQAQIDEGLAQLEAGEAQAAAGRAELEAGEAQLDAGERIAALSEGMRLVNEEGTVAMTQLSLLNTGGFIEPELVADIQQVADDLTAKGVETHLSAELTSDIESLFGPAEAVGLAVAALVLILMLGTLVAAGLPLLMAFVGVGVGLTAAMALSSVVDMMSVTPALALMLGLAVGIDYSLFLINRHRKQVRHGMDVKDSIALSVGTSGNAVTFAGLTVIVALSALTLTGIPFLGVMGLVAAGTVAIAVLVALTLTPALLSLMGMRVLPRKARAAVLSGQDREVADEDRREADTHHGWAAVVQRHPWLSILGVLAIVALLIFIL